MASLSADQVKAKASLETERNRLKDAMRLETVQGVTDTARITADQIKAIEAKISDIDRYPQG